MSKIDKQFDAAHNKVLKRIIELNLSGKITDTEGMALGVLVLKVEQAAINLGKSL